MRGLQDQLAQLQHRTDFIRDRKPTLNFTCLSGRFTCIKFSISPNNGKYKENSHGSCVFSLVCMYSCDYLFLFIFINL